MKVPFVNWKLQYQKLKPEIDSAIQCTLARGDIIARDDVEEFERRLARYTKTKYAIGLNSGTDALYLSLRALGIGPGDEVITVSWTFVATIATIAQTGATPILIDVHEDNYLMNPDLIERAITKKTKVIIPVHFNGIMCDMDRILDIAQKHGLGVIEDSAQAFSRHYGENMAGSMGDTGCFSFYPSKFIGAYGDAGGVVTNNEEIYKKIRLLQDHGRATKTETVCFGVNSRLDNIQAAIINVKFNHLNEIKNRRQEVVKRYKEGIKDIPQLIMKLPDYCENFVMETEKRNELFEFLSKNGIETQIHEPIPYHKQLKELQHFNLPITEQLANRVISLPLNEDITNEEVDYIISKLKEYYSKIVLKNKSSL